MPNYKASWNHPTFAVGTLISLVALFSVSLTCPGKVPAADYVVIPSTISLTGQAASARWQVQQADIEDGQAIAGLTISKGVHPRIADPQVARIEGNRIVAAGNGATELLVQVEGSDKVARIPVVVAAADRPLAVQLEAHVQAILSRQACNSGACHGALAGKGGFKLSLLGYDWQMDHYTISGQDRGRRIEPTQPDSSLLLTKPTNQVPHKGGLRLEPDSADYRTIANWIASGSPGRQESDARLASVEILPARVRLKVGDRQSQIVRAHYSDGRVEEVTHWAKFSSTNEAVARVDAQGNIEIVGQGRAAIVGWFSSRIAIATIDVPYAGHAQDGLRLAALESFHAINAIDQLLLEEWRSLSLSPSDTCDDPTFLRRASLDLTGSLPDSTEVQEFLADTSTDKRQRLVDRLLQSQSYVDYWSYRLSDLMLVNGNLLRPEAVKAFYNWIRKQVEENTPWDQFARQVVLARGDSMTDGATNFYAIHQTPEAMTENTCLAFLGLSIECAKCHNHPLERWTNDQYYAMANLFARVRGKGWGGDSRNGDGKRTLVVLDRGDLIQPSRGKPQPPAPLDQAALDSESTEDRRIALADWLTSDNNPYFARAIVNRVWANFMGTGLVEEVDDLRASNPASSERLMAYLTEQLKANRYDLKSLMKLIMGSRTYQLSSTASAFNGSDQRFFCRYYPRRLMAEVLHDAVVKVTGVPTLFDKIAFSGADKQTTSFYPLGTKSIALYDSAVSNYFLQTFGRNQRRITCECERSDQPTVVQALHFSNGDTLNDKLSDQSCVITDWLKEGLSGQQIVERAYLRALSRPPTSQESQQVTALLDQADQGQVERRELIEDLLWSLMSSAEFMFAH